MTRDEKLEIIAAARENCKVYAEQAHAFYEEDCALQYRDAMQLAAQNAAIMSAFIADLD